MTIYPAGCLKLASSILIEIFSPREAVDWSAIGSEVYELAPAAYPLVIAERTNSECVSSHRFEAGNSGLIGVSRDNLIGIGICDIKGSSFAIRNLIANAGSSPSDSGIIAANRYQFDAVRTRTFSRRDEMHTCPIAHLRCQTSTTYVNVVILVNGKTINLAVRRRNGVLLRGLQIRRIERSIAYYILPRSLLHTRMPAYCSVLSGDASSHKVSYGMTRAGRKQDMDIRATRTYVETADHAVVSRRNRRIIAIAIEGAVVILQRAVRRPALRATIAIAIRIGNHTHYDIALAIPSKRSSKLISLPTACIYARLRAVNHLQREECR